MTTIDEKEKEEEEEFLKEFDLDWYGLGNNHHYGLLKETFEERGNALLAKSNAFLNQNPNINVNTKIEIVNKQFWVVGFLSGQNLIVKPENFIRTIQI